MPTVVLKLFARQGYQTDRRPDGQSSDYMLPPLIYQNLNLYTCMCFRIKKCFKCKVMYRYVVFL